MLATTGTPATLTGILTWDAAGDNPASAQFTITLVAAMTTASTYIGAVIGDFPFRRPAGVGTAGTIYLFLKTDAGTVTLQIARLHWSEDVGR